MVGTAPEAVQNEDGLDGRLDEGQRARTQGQYANQPVLIEARHGRHHQECVESAESEERDDQQRRVEAAFFGYGETQLLQLEEADDHYDTTEEEQCDFRRTEDQTGCVAILQLLVKDKEAAD